MKGSCSDLWKRVFEHQEQHPGSWLAPHTVVLTGLELPFTLSQPGCSCHVPPPLSPPWHFISLTHI